MHKNPFSPFFDRPLLRTQDKPMGYSKLLKPIVPPGNGYFKKAIKVLTKPGFKNQDLIPLAVRIFKISYR
jgi:hypothetical protein